MDNLSDLELYNRCWPDDQILPRVQPLKYVPTPKPVDTRHPLTKVLQFIFGKPKPYSTMKLSPMPFEQRINRGFFG